MKKSMLFMMLALCTAQHSYGVEPQDLQPQDLQRSVRYEHSYQSAVDNINNGHKNNPYDYEKTYTKADILEEMYNIHYYGSHDDIPLLATFNNGHGLPWDFEKHGQDTLDVRRGFWNKLTPAEREPLIGHLFHSLVGPNAYEYYCTIKNNPEKREEIEKGIIFRLSNSICGEPLNNPDNLSIEQMVDNDLEHFQAMKSRYFFNRPDDVTKLLELMDITI